MPFFFPSALLTNFTKSSPRGTISSALRYQMLQNCKISAGSMTSRILIVTPACRENPIKKGNEGITFCYQGFSPYSSLLNSSLPFTLLIFAHFSYVYKIILYLLGRIKNYFILFCNFFVFFCNFLTVLC